MTYEEMKPWSIPKLWAGETVLILGNGPSLLSLLSESLLRSHPIIGINEAGFLLRKESDIMFFGDAFWYWMNKEQVDQMPFVKVTYARHPEVVPDLDYAADVHLVAGASGFGICKRESKIRFNRSSGGAAINLAYHLGAAQVVLLGYDMRQVLGNKNWFRRGYESGRTKEMSYTNFLEPFPTIKKDAKALGLEIYNGTPYSDLTIFPLWVQ
jgi:hypothetical protein